jgi:hypothetical protein
MGEACSIHRRDEKCVDENILEWILEKEGGKNGVDASGSGKGPVAVSCEHGNEPSSSIKRGFFLIS